MPNRCRSPAKLAKRSQRPHAQVQRQLAQIAKQKAALEPMTADANKWLELKEKIRRQIKDVRTRSKALEERRSEHQRELATVRTATISHHQSGRIDHHRSDHHLRLHSSAVAFQAG